MTAYSANLDVVSPALRNVTIRSGSQSVVTMSREDMLEAIGEAMEELAFNEKKMRRTNRSTKKMAQIED